MEKSSTQRSVVFERPNKPIRLAHVYEWQPDPHYPLSGFVQKVVRELPRLIGDGTKLVGQYVHVVNRGMVREVDPVTGRFIIVPMGNAKPDASGNFFFEPGHGGGRMDKTQEPDPAFRGRYIQAARFGEVNTYYHLDKIASYINELLNELGVSSLPRVTAVVTAHDGVAEHNGVRDGIRKVGYLAFEGGHYRLPRHRFDIPEWHPISPSGEIHLGPGRHLRHKGALAEFSGGRYRANASHNAAILYHEYGHHIIQHTADFLANSMRLVNRQRNVKTFIDEGTADYWSAVMLESPHIGVWFRLENENGFHRRNLVSDKTMEEFDSRSTADPHTNGTIWATTLWDLRQKVGKDSGRMVDKLVLQALLLIGSLKGQTIKETAYLRSNLDTVLDSLIEADQILYQGKNRSKIIEVLNKHGIRKDD